MQISKIYRPQKTVFAEVFTARGPRSVLKTLKHEFGHGYVETGDGYISDFTRTDDEGNSLYGNEYFQGFRYTQDFGSIQLCSRCIKPQMASNC